MTHAFDKFRLRVGVMVIFDRKLFAGILIKLTKEFLPATIQV
jgi:hypothetical protein